MVPLLTHYLSLLFSLMLSHCYTSTSFCVSTMIPIPKKGSGSMNDIRNYRGIALSSLLSKVFDHCIIGNHYDSLRSDDLQFAYKSKISAIHCVNSVNEAVPGMGSNHPFKSLQQIDLKSQMTYKSLDHDFRLRITLNVFDP